MPTNRCTGRSVNDNDNCSLARGVLISLPCNKRSTNTRPFSTWVLLPMMRTERRPEPGGRGIKVYQEEREQGRKSKKVEGKREMIIYKGDNGNKTTNQSISPSINQSINSSINKSIVTSLPWIMMVSVTLIRALLFPLNKRMVDPLKPITKPARSIGHCIT